MTGHRALRIIATGRTSWQARAWMLERMYPDRYRKRTMFGGAGSPIQIKSDLKVAESIRLKPRSD